MLDALLHDPCRHPDRHRPRQARRRRPRRAHHHRRVLDRHDPLDADRGPAPPARPCGPRRSCSPRSPPAPSPSPSSSSWLVAAPTLHSHDAVLDLGRRRRPIASCSAASSTWSASPCSRSRSAPSSGSPPARSRPCSGCCWWWRSCSAPCPADFFRHGQPVPAGHRRAPAARHPGQHRAGPSRHQRTRARPVDRVTP